jgi:hypothetical protein
MIPEGIAGISARPKVSRYEDQTDQPISDFFGSLIRAAW